MNTANHRYCRRYSRLFAATVAGAVAVGVLMAAVPARAQQQQPPEKPAFPQVFPQPTGQNGYEDLVRAGDLLRHCKAFTDLESAAPETLTLTLRRQVLNDLMVRQARGMVQVGLAKPMTPPRTDIGPETLMPDLAVMRSVGRLLMNEMYVDLADGHSSSAITTYAQTLQLCEASRGDAIIGGLVGASVDRMGADMLARHMEQLSVRDCDRLVALVRERLSLPNPAFAALATERRSLVGYLTTLETQEPTERAMTNIGLLTASDEENAKYRPLRDALQDPNLRGPMIQESITHLNAQYERIAARFNDPTLPPAPPFHPRTLGEQLADTFMTVENTVVMSFTRNRVELQLLGVQALIRKYRWEHDKLPDTLGDINGRGLQIDVCTGQALLYKKTGDTTYELSSAGLPTGDSNARSPFTLPFRRPKN